MSIELSSKMTGSSRAPFEHRIDHDIESLLLVLMHIVRFTPGPVGNPKHDILIQPPEFRISQWHHETFVAQIPHLKTSDLMRLRDCEDLQAVLPTYWRPIASIIVNLIDIVYPVPILPLRTGTNLFKAFRQELVNALELCQQLEETPHKYGTSMPFQTRMPPKKRKSTRDNAGPPQPGKSTVAETRRSTKAAKAARR